MGEIQYIQEKYEMGFALKCIKDIVDIIETFIGEKIKIALGISKEEIIELANYIVYESGLMEDIDRTVQCDPASMGIKDYVYHSYVGIEALKYYRIAHRIMEKYILNSVDGDAGVIGDIDENKL